MAYKTSYVSTIDALKSFKITTLHYPQNHKDICANLYYILAIYLHSRPGSVTSCFFILLNNNSAPPLKRSRVNSLSNFQLFFLYGFSYCKKLQHPILLCLFKKVIRCGIYLFTSLLLTFINFSLGIIITQSKSIWEFLSFFL